MPYGVCKICGCTDNAPCHNPLHGNCWWVDETHELCSHCADPEIYNDPQTSHCINSTNTYYLSIAEILVCAHCKHWHQYDKGIEDEEVWGLCDANEYDSCGSDSICADFEESSEDKSNNTPSLLHSVENNQIKS